MAWLCLMLAGCDPTDGDGGTAAHADPDYERACQPDDFVCETWGCRATTLETVQPHGCYKPCDTDEPGTLDDECDEPERPYCSEVADSNYGDYTCNFSTTVCLAAPETECH